MFFSADIADMGMTVDVTSYQDAFAYFDKVTWLNCNNPNQHLYYSRNQVEIFQPNCWDNYSDLLEKIPVTPRSRWERSFEIISTTNFLIFLVSDVCLRLRWLSVPHSADNELFCRSVQCVFFGSVRSSSSHNLRPFCTSLSESSSFFHRVSLVYLRSLQALL